MYIKGKTLDDMLRKVLWKLLKSKERIKPTRGEARELTGVLLQVDDPRARLSLTEIKGTLFSCLGELLWYLSGTNDLEFISYYVPSYRKESSDGKTVYGGYGPRLFNIEDKKTEGKNINQINNVLALLREKPDSRRAVIQLFDAADIAREQKEIPCTCTLQFIIRNQQLHMFTNMRSNDAFLGLPHDVFAFTMFQEIIARTLCVELGTYKHAVGSLHLYDEHRKKAKKYLEEGWQPTTISMPQMPLGDPWPSINLILEAESTIRTKNGSQINHSNFDPYWADLARLLQIYKLSKEENIEEITKLKKNMSHNIYTPYIRKKQLSKISSNRLFS